MLVTENHALTSTTDPIRNSERYKEQHNKHQVIRNSQKGIRNNTTSTKSNTSSKLLIKYGCNIQSKDFRGSTSKFKLKPIHYKPFSIGDKKIVTA